MMLSTAAARTMLACSRSRPAIRQRLSLTTRPFAAKATAKKDAKPKQQKVAASAAPRKKPGADTGGRPSDLQLLLAALDAPMRQEPPISQEERDRRHQIGRNYVIGNFRRHNEINHDLACKLQLKNHAIKMLPKNSKLKEEALKIDDSGPPPWIRHAVWTPPIPGFNPSQFVGAEKE